MKKNTLKNLIICIIVFTIIVSAIVVYSNLHLHLFVNGTCVVHGHPLNGTNDKTPVNTHQHSPLDHFVILSLLFDDKLILVLCVILLFLQFLQYTKKLFENIPHNKFIISFPSLRAPPLY